MYSYCCPVSVLTETNRKKNLAITNIKLLFQLFSCVPFRFGIEEKIIDYNNFNPFSVLMFEELKNVSAKIWQIHLLVV